MPIKAEFPSTNLVKEVLRGRGLLHEFFKRGVVESVGKELCIIVHEVASSLMRYVDENPLPLSSDKMPTMAFSTALLSALRLSKTDSEDAVLQLFTLEVKEYIKKRNEPLSFKNGYELACDVNGELVLRIEQDLPSLPANVISMISTAPPSSSSIAATA